MKNILVTGGAGFIGSAFVRHMVKAHPDYTIVTYDKLTYAGNMNNLLPVSDEPNHQFERGDIADRDAVRAALQAHQIDTVVNFAAESHVDRSILDADAFMHTNSIGVYILLDEGRKHGIERFLQVSTDEVYGSVPEGVSVESDPLAPRNPYSAAKAGGELMARAYYETHDLNVVITRGQQHLRSLPVSRKADAVLHHRGAGGSPAAAVRRRSADARLAVRRGSRRRDRSGAAQGQGRAKPTTSPGKTCATTST